MPIVEAGNRLGKRPLSELKGWSHCELNDPCSLHRFAPAVFWKRKGALPPAGVLPHPALLLASRTSRG